MSKSRGIAAALSDAERRVSYLRNKEAAASRERSEMVGILKAVKRYQSLFAYVEANAPELLAAWTAERSIAGNKP